MTALKQALLEILSKKDGPKSVPEMLILLNQKGHTPNKTTLYRQLERLIEVSLVQEVQIKGSTQYFEMQVQHHHHFVCQKCDDIRCIEDESLEKAIHSLEDQIIKKGMKVLNHQFSFNGVCHNCL